MTDTPTLEPLPPIPEFMVRVKLPSPAAYHCSPSGDNEYEDALMSAINTAKPCGFEVRYARGNQRWAVDSEGFTLVPLYCTDEKNALWYWMEQTHRLQDQLERIRKRIKALPL